MKKIRFLLIFLISMIVLPNMVLAASGSIKVTGTSTAVVGNKVTVTVTLSSSTSIGSWQMQLNYDKSYLQLTSSSAEAGGTVMSNSSSGTKSKTYTFTFKTLKTGTTNVSIGSYLVYADMSEMSISAGSKSIKIITQAELEASYSKDNNLKNLSVDGFEISPAFSKDVTEYNVTVPEGTKEVKVNASLNDSKASVSGDGIIQVNEGANNIAIVVRAENGSEKTYNLIVNVIDQHPINVSVDGQDFTVVKLRENYLCPELFNESETIINDITVPTCTNDKINYTLVGLRNANNEIFNYIYDNNKYIRYTELIGTSIKIINEKYDGTIEGLKETTLKINDIEYQVFKLNDSSRFCVVYGMNVESGEKDLYLYDTKNKTFSVYDEEYIDYLKELNKTYLYVIIAFGIGLFLSLICVITISKKKNNNKKNKEKKIKNKLEEKNNKKNSNEEKAKDNSNEIVEDNKVAESYNLFETDKKKTKKNKNKKERK